MAGTAPPPREPGPDRAAQRRPAPARRRALRVAAGVLIVVVALLAALATTLWWSLRTERGSAWLLSVLPGVEVDAPRGTLLGDFHADRLVVTPTGGGRITLTDFGWRGLTLARAASPRWARIGIDALTAQRVDVVAAPAQPNAPPAQAPTSLALPVEVDLRALRIGELHAAPLGAQPVRDVDAQLHVGADGGAMHRLEHLSFAWDRMRVDAKARITSAAPMRLEAEADAGQPAVGSLPAWQAHARVDGPLAEPVLQATLRASPAGARPAASLDARATLHPFAAWPLGELQAQAQALDLSAFASAAPATALTLDARAKSSAADQPAQLDIDLANAIAGRWDEGRLPLRSAQIVVAARPDRPSVLDVRRLEVELGTPQAPAGRLTGTGRWTPERWNLDATLAELRPARLDGRAPPMRWNGPVTLVGTPADQGSVDAKLELAGELNDGAASRALRLRLDATLNPQRVEVRELALAAGPARATVSGVASRAAADAPWTVKAKGRLDAFDPGLWIAGDPASPWRQARNALNGTLDVDLAVPAPAPGQPPAGPIAALRGSAALTVAPSVLAGVPIEGHATLRHAAEGPADVELQFDAAGNAVRATGRIATRGDGADDAWDVTVGADALARLEPVFRLFQPAGADTALAGTLHVDAHASGRWPALTTNGTLAANGLRVGAIGLRSADARWTAGTSADAPIDAQATLAGLTLAQPASTRGAAPSPAPGPSLEAATLKLSGSARAHTVELSAESKLRPPAWVEASGSTATAAPGPSAPEAASAAAAGAAASAAAPSSGAAPPPDARTALTLRASGGIVAQGDAAFAGWRGTIGSLVVRSDAAGTAPLLRTADVALEALWAGAAPRVTVEPGRAEILSAAVRWQRIAWQGAAAPGAPGRIEADAELEPLRVAPLLAQAQPGFGWGGDLRVAGHVRLRSTPAFEADVVVERSAGDLTITDELGTRALGLTDLRVGLAADRGVWNFTLGLAGRTLGVASGAVVVRAQPTALWPAPDAPIDGVLEVRVADLASLSTWVPPGWRVEGGLHASAAIGGRFGAPEYTGEVVGTDLAVRNFLEGIKVTDGDVAISLKGETARIERFTAKAGGGSIRLDGGARFGATPQAELSLSADHFQLLGRVDRRVVVSGAGTLRIDARTLGFDGRFGVDEGLIDFSRGDAPKLSSDVTVVRAAGAPSPQAAASAAATAPPRNPAAAAGTPKREVRLDLRVGLGKQLKLRGRGLDARLEGDLHLTAPQGQLAVDGTVEVVDGTYQAYGQKLTIDRGRVTFNGRIDNPRLDIEATRPKTGDVRVGVKATGSPANLRIRLFSEPDMSEVDKLSWLVMGRASNSLGSTETALLQRAALALVSGEGPGVADQITKSLGLDELSVGQSDGDVKTTVVTLGKQISERLYLGYEQGLNAAGGSFQLIYRIAQRFTLRAQSGADNSLDLIWTFRWQ